MNADQITGEHIRLLMWRGKISQEHLGEVLGISQAAAGKKLRGLRTWTLDELLATAQFLNVEVTELLPGTDYAPVLTGRGRSGSARLEGLEPPTFWMGAASDVERSCYGLAA